MEDKLLASPGERGQQLCSGGNSADGQQGTVTACVSEVESIGTADG